MIRSPVAPKATHDSITDAASRMQRSARPDGKRADTTAQDAAKISATSNGRSEAVAKLSAS